MPIIYFENVSYSYSKTDTKALDNINLSVNKGEILAVMGKNGSGKTTFCKLINGIIPHLSGGTLTGAVTVDGIRTDRSTVPELAQIAGLVLDDPDIQILCETVKSEAAFGCENLLVPVCEIEKRIEEALSLTGLAGFENRRTATLSGGEKQRLAIASFLSMKSRILVLDEPLSRLDPEGAEKVLSVLKDLKDKHGVTVIISSHNSSAMQKFASKVCILNEGRIAAIDTAENIFSNYALLEENGIPSIEEYDIQSYFTQAIENFQTSTTLPPAPCPLTPVIQIKNFSFSYNKETPFLNNINLIINEGDFAAIIGPNGCGKTTLLKNITGLLRKNKRYIESGGILIHGKNSLEMTVSQISRVIGFVMQNPDNQLFTDSVYNEAAFGLVNAGLSKQEIGKTVEDALKAVGLKDKNAFPHALCYTDRTKLVISCVLAMGAKILIFDEIDIGQDYQGMLQIMNLAHDLHSKGYTIIFTTHNMFLACRYANILIKMEKNGSISKWNRKG